MPQPPNGAVRSRTKKQFVQTVPARIASLQRAARAASRGEDHRREPVARGVREGDGLVLVVEPLEREHRSEDLGLDDLGVVGARQDEGGLVPERVVLPSAPAEGDLVAGGTGAVDEALDAREVVGVDERGDRRRGVAGVAEYVGVGRLAEPLEERVVDRGLDEQAGAGEADLPRVVVHPRRGRRRGVEVRVGEDEERSFATELGGEGHEVAGGLDADRDAGRRRAGEADAPHARVGDEGGPHLARRSPGPR